MDRWTAEKALIRLARQSAATWRSVRGAAFLGEITIQTGNALYHFKDGVFSGRALKPKNGDLPAWESPPEMQGVELIGFLADESGLWSLSPRWRPGALAVMSSSKDGYRLTSATLACTIVRPEAPLRTAPAGSDVFDVPGSRPPTVRRPAPPSMTRLQLAPPGPVSR